MSDVRKRVRQIGVRHSSLAELLYRMNGQSRYGRNLGDWSSLEGEPRTHYERQANWLRQRLATPACGHCRHALLVEGAATEGGDRG